MRRVLLFAAFLLLLGLTTATAASFDVQAEDITSFSTPVSIELPKPPLLVETYFLVGGIEADDIPGDLVTVEPPPDPVKTKTIVPSLLTIDANHTEPSTYHAWDSAGFLSPFTVEGNVTVTVNFDGVTNQFIAGIFRCATGPLEEGVPLTVDADLPAGAECTLLGSGPSTGTDSGFKERSAKFAISSPSVIAAGEWLRLKIVNNSTAEWRLQWGFNDARESGLLVNE